MTYSIAACEFLLRGDDATGSLCCIKSALAANNSLAGTCRAATGLCSNLGDGIPVAHFGCV